jgi:hypothetical protein
MVDGFSSVRRACIAAAGRLMAIICVSHVRAKLARRAKIAHVRYHRKPVSVKSIGPIAAVDSAHARSKSRSALKTSPVLLYIEAMTQTRPFSRPEFR